MRERFQWPSADGGEDEDYSGESPDVLVGKLAELALARHEQHVGKIHASWSRAIGLSSRRLSRRTRYAPNDRLLKSIVVAIVDDRMQFDEFLAEAKRRYGLVLGDAEGARLRQREARRPRGAQREPRQPRSSARRAGSRPPALRLLLVC